MPKTSTNHQHASGLSAWPFSILNTHNLTGPKHKGKWFLLFVKIIITSACHSSMITMVDVTVVFQTHRFSYFSNNPWTKPTSQEMNHIIKYRERHIIIKMTLTHMASTEAYIITSTILGLYFIAKNQFLHGETEWIFLLPQPYWYTLLLSEFSIFCFHRITL